MLARLPQSKNAHCSRLVMLDGMITLLSTGQSSKVAKTRLVRLVERMTFVRLEQARNACSRVVTLLGRVRLVNPPPKAPLPIPVTPSGILRFFRLLQAPNVKLPMILRLFGSATFVRL